MLASEFKKQIEAMTQGQVQVSFCEPSKDALIRPAINWNSTPEYVRELLRSYMDTPYEER